MTQPTEAEAAKRRFVAFTAETIRNATSTEYPNVYPGEDHAWSVEKFRDNFKVEFHENEKYDSSFSLIGINAAIANAYRRILIAEVPTLAIENVYVINNTSVIQDEVLAQRLGLIPFTGAKAGFQWLRPFVKPLEGQTGGSVQTDYNTVVLKLDVKCDWVRNGKDLWKKGEREPTKLWENAHGMDICFGLH
jgi:DNA-directed RNA polymerase I and III subunit RPAC1